MTAPFLGQGMPANESWFAEQLKSLQRQITELRAAQTLNASSIGTTGMAILGGALRMPVISGGNVPGSIWWDDGFDHHGAIYQQQTDNQTVLQSPWNDTDPNHPTLFFDPTTKVIQLYISQDDASVDEPYLYLIGTPASSQVIELFVNSSTTGYSTFVAFNGIFVHRTTAGHGQILLGSRSGTDEHIIVQGVAFQVFNQVTIQIGAGDAGLTYYEDWNLAAQVVTTGAQATVTGMSLGTARSDYAATAMNTTTGVWTAPGDGNYSFTFVGGFDTWASGSRLGLRILNQTANQVIGNRDTNPTVTTMAKDTLTARKHCAAGDTVIFQITNGTAASRTVSAVAPETCYISVQRELS